MKSVPAPVPSRRVASSATQVAGVLVILLGALACEGADRRAARTHTELDSILPQLPNGESNCSFDSPDSVRAFEMPPAIRNRRASIELLNRFADLGEGEHTAQIWLEINAKGEVEGVDMADSTGSTTLDELLPRFAAGLDFFPATRQGEPVCARVQFPFAVLK